MTEEKSGQGTIPVSHAASRTLFTPSTALKGMQSFHLLLYAWGVWSLLSSELLTTLGGTGGYTARQNSELATNAHYSNNKRAGGRPV